jgi:hypothetical protein
MYGFAPGSCVGSVLSHWLGNSGYFTATSASYSRLVGLLFCHQAEQLACFVRFGFWPVLFRLFMWLFSCPVRSHFLFYLRHAWRPGPGFMCGQVWSKLCVFICFRVVCDVCSNNPGVVKDATRLHKYAANDSCSTQEVEPYATRSVLFCNTTSQYRSHLHWRTR